jgi:hypothetical protein
LGCSNGQRLPPASFGKSAGWDRRKPIGESRVSLMSNFALHPPFQNERLPERRPATECLSPRRRGGRDRSCAPFAARHRLKPIKSMF